MSKYHLGWNYFQHQKKVEQRKKLIKDVVEITLAILIMLTAMALGGQTYPY